MCLFWFTYSGCSLDFAVRSRIELIIIIWLAKQKPIQSPILFRANRVACNHQLSAPHFKKSQRLIFNKWTTFFSVRWMKTVILIKMLPAIKKKMYSCLVELSNSHGSWTIHAIFRQRLLCMEVHTVCICAHERKKKTRPNNRLYSHIPHCCCRCCYET